MGEESQPPDWRSILASTACPPDRFVGRRALRRRILEAPPGAFMVLGLPRVGKTSLLLKLRQQAAGREVKTLDLYRIRQAAEAPGTRRGVLATVARWSEVAALLRSELQVEGPDPAAYFVESVRDELKLDPSVSTLMGLRRPLRRCWSERRDLVLEIYADLCESPEHRLVSLVEAWVRRRKIDRVSGEPPDLLLVDEMQAIERERWGRDLYSALSNLSDELALTTVFALFPDTTLREEKKTHARETLGGLGLAPIGELLDQVGGPTVTRRTAVFSLDDRARVALSDIDVRREEGNLDWLAHREHLGADGRLAPPVNLTADVLHAWTGGLPSLVKGVLYDAFDRRLPASLILDEVAAGHRRLSQVNDALDHWKGMLERPDRDGQAEEAGYALMTGRMRASLDAPTTSWLQGLGVLDRWGQPFHLLSGRPQARQRTQAAERSAPAFFLLPGLELDGGQLRALQLRQNQPGLFVRGDLRIPLSATDLLVLQTQALFGHTRITDWSHFCQLATLTAEVPWLRERIQIRPQTWKSQGAYYRVWEASRRTGPQLGLLDEYFEKGGGYGTRTALSAVPLLLTRAGLERPAVPPGFWDALNPAPPRDLQHPPALDEAPTWLSKLLP